MMWGERVVDCGAGGGSARRCEKNSPKSLIPLVALHDDCTTFDMMDIFCMYIAVYGIYIHAQSTL